MTLADQYRQEGREQGRQEGRQEGLELGELIALRKTVLIVLEGRFNTVPVALAALLDGINQRDRLEILRKAAANCESLEDFAARLCNAPSPSRR